MITNEPQFGNRVRRVLTEGARVDARIAERLRAARERALERRRLAPASVQETAAAQVSAAGVIGRFGGVGGFSLRLVLPTLILSAGLFSIWSWQEDQRANDVEEIDAMLLTDDLPIDAYLDKGFETWLRKVSNGTAARK